MERMIKKNLLISENNNILQALKLLNKNNGKCLIVMNKFKQIVGTVTDGDIRRAFLYNQKTTTKLKKICNKNYKFIFDYNFNESEVKKIIKKENDDFILPIINKEKKLLKIYSKQNFLKNKKISKINFNLPVVIMAGGLGLRMKPVTNILPKPLMPVGNKTVIEIIIDRFYEQGLNNFILTLNYKKNFIKAYFKDLKKKYSLKYIDENKPLGTAGSLSFLKNYNSSAFLVANCDNLISLNFRNFYNFHKNNNYDFTIVVSQKKFTIPYGVCEINNNDNSFVKIFEKPKYDYLVNTGVYIINKKVILKIKNNKKMDMNELINEIKKNKFKIGIYPINENSWVDVGQWSRYTKFLHKFKS